MSGPRTSFEYGRLGGTSGLDVLVADDDAPSRRLLEAVFGSCGCAVTLALDGTDAANLALSRPFDLICLDRHMPHLTGDEVAEHIRFVHGDGLRPFLVMCTSDPRSDDAMHPFDAALSKPITLQGVVDVIAEALQFRLAWRSEPAGPAPRRQSAVA